MCQFSYTHPQEHRCHVSVITEKPLFVKNDLRLVNVSPPSLMVTTDQWLSISMVALPVWVASFGTSSAGVAQAVFLAEFLLRQGEALNREEC